MNESNDPDVCTETSTQDKHDESIRNVSTEPHVDDTILDRLSGLAIGGDEDHGKSNNHLNATNSIQDSTDQNEQNVKPDDAGETTKPEKSAELRKSILAGEVSDNSECSVDVDDGESKEDDNNKGVSSSVSDEEMFIEDQDEEVEEEEEFHEFEEEKHKTSQESVEGEKGVTPSARRSSSNSAGEPTSKSANKEDKVPTENRTKLESSADESLEKDPVQEPPTASELNSTETRSPTAETADESAAPDPPSTTITSSTATTTSTTLPTSTSPTTEDDNQEKDNSTEEVKNIEESKTSDWANIMLSNIQSPEEQNENSSTISSVLEKPSSTSPTADKPALEQSLDEDALAKDKSAGKTDDVEKKELDLDEDVKNPQYIPKKGVFYEHDDRSHEVEGEKQSSLKKDDESLDVKDPVGSKKSQVLDKQSENRRGRRQRTETDRWNHDLFRDEKQKPKSKSELINAYGYDIRQERSSRNQTDNRTQRGPNNNPDRNTSGQDNQRSRPNRDNRIIRQGQPSNRSRERKPRRQNNNNRHNKNDVIGAPTIRDVQNNRSVKTESKDIKSDGFESTSNAQSHSSFQSNRRDNYDGSREKNTRNDIRNRRQNSRDRPNTNQVDDKLPPINTVMPPITTWSNKIVDMVKEEVNSKEPMPRHQQQQHQHQHQQHQQHGMNNSARSRSNEYWPTNHSNKVLYQDRSAGMGIEDNRHLQNHQHPRRYQDRDDANRQAQFANRNQNQWRRTSNYSSYAKTNEPIKTQTFENSRLSQNSMNRTLIRDGRDIINERRMQNQPSFQPKVQHSSAGLNDQHLSNQPSFQPKVQSSSATPAEQQLPSQQSFQPKAQPISTASNEHHLHQHQPNFQPKVQPNSVGPAEQQVHQQPNFPAKVQPCSVVPSEQQLHHQKPIQHQLQQQQQQQLMPQSHQQQQQQQHQHQHQHQQPQQHQQMAQHQQHYTPNTRDPAAAAAALASAYHGYIPSGHSVMDTSRYHMTSQQMSEHGYMPTPGQANDVLHQPRMYTAAGGTVASSAYLAQAGSTLSPSTNIPVTGAGGPPLPPVSYLQHSQYAPPPYSNPYSQPQHNQAPPPQSSHAYPYWTYI